MYRRFDLNISSIFIWQMFLFALINGAYAQSSSNYSFSTNNNGYLTRDLYSDTINLNIGATQLIGPGTDSDISDETTIGFDYYFMGTNIKTFSCNENGIIELGAHTISADLSKTSTSAIPNLLAPFGQNLQTGIDGEVHCKLFGTSPNRVFVIEYFNMMISFAGVNNALAGAATFQVRLYETTGILEYVYGQMATNNSVQNLIPVETGWIVNTTPNNFFAIDSLYNTSTIGNWPTFIVPQGSIVNHLNSISEGSRRIYRFTPPQTAVVAPTGLSFSSVAATTMTINWTDRSTNETNFNILISSNNTNFSKISTLNSFSTGTVGTGYNYTVKGLSPNTTYYFRIAANTEAISSPFLAGIRATTIPKAYHWIGTGNTFFEDPANWNPNRFTPDPTDSLYFDNGLSSTINYVISQSVSKIVVSNNTLLRMNSDGGDTLLISAKIPNAFLIATGSSIINTALFPNTVTISFTNGNGATASIAGTFELGKDNSYNTTNCITSVSGTIANAGNVYGATRTNLIFLSTGVYNHKYTVSPGVVPTATWNIGSLCLISGYTANPNILTSLSGQQFYNLTWDCPAQQVYVNLGGFFPASVNGTFKMANGLLRLQTNASPTLVLNNFIQTGGSFDLNNGGGSCTMKVSGTFNQSGGIFAPSAGGGLPILEFNGTSGVQQVNFFNSAPTGSLIYKISNPNGINLTGTGTLTTYFNININCGVRIATVATTPINTFLKLTYNTTSTTLTYEAPSDMTMTPTEFPLVSGPGNVAINMPGSVANMPFSRVIPGSLIMSGGEINIGANSITLGTSSTLPGNLSWASGNIRVTSGSMTRWFNTTGLPTQPGSQIGFFPIANGLDNRNVSIYGTSQFITGGSITVSHSNVPGITTGISISDLGYIIQRRTNSSWTFVNRGIVSNLNSIGIRATGANLLSSNSPTQLRLTQANSVIGVTANGSGTAPNLRAERINIHSNQLSTTLYIGASDTHLDPYYVATTSGNWSNPAIWSSGIVPGLANNAIIELGAVVTTDGTNQCKSLTINPGGTLNVPNNSILIDNTLSNNGNLNVTGGDLIINGGQQTAQGFTTTSGSNTVILSGTFTIGPLLGGNKRWIQSGGTATIAGGTININGSILISAGNFNQTNGNIIIDGNNGTSASGSVANGLHLFQVTGGTLSFNGGTIMIVDPPYVASKNSLAISIKTITTSTNAFTGTHTFIFGNGISNTVGYNVTGFCMETYSSSSGGRVPLKNVIINSGNASGRFVRNTLVNTNGTQIQGTLTINPNSEYRIVTNTISRDCIGGHIINNGTLTASGTLTLGGENGIYSINNPQTISGTGVFQNQQISSTANFSGITLNNPGGITSTIGNISYSGILTFQNGNLSIGNNKIEQIAGGSIAGSFGASSHIKGKFQQHTNTGSFVLNFPIGDNLNYTPVSIIGAAGSVITPGDILVSTFPSEHPLISTANINSSKDITRHYTLQSLNGITYATGSLSVILNWTNSDIDAGANTTNFVLGKTENGGWVYPTIKSKSANNIYVTDVSSLGDFIVGEKCNLNTNFSYPNSPYCNNGTVTPQFNNGGIAGIFTEPSGLVSINSNTGVINLASSTPGTYIITNTIANTGCQPSSSTANITIIGNSVATVNITSSANPTCSGLPLTFTAVPVNGGNPTYQWQLNNVNVGINSAVYTNSNLTNGSIIKCKMTTSLTCVAVNQVTSNILSITVNSTPAAPIVTILGSTTISCGGFATLLSSYQGIGNTWSPAGIMNDTLITTAGTFSVTYTDTNNCTSSPSLPVIISLVNQTGPLNGSFTINPGITSCTNYNSLYAIISELNTRGINGTVTIDVPSGYTETAPLGGLQIKMCGLPDSIQPKNTQSITFRKTGSGSNPLLLGNIGNSTQDGIVKIIGTDYITFDGIDVNDTMSTGNSASQIEWGYALLKCNGTKGSSHNTIKNCNISLQKSNISSSGIYLNNHTEQSNVPLIYSGSQGSDQAFRSSFNVFSGNSISNSYSSVSLSGSNFFNDSLNEIGKSGSSPNLFSNVGGGVFATSIISVANQQRVKINNNILNGGDGTTGVLNGIFAYPNSGFSGDIVNNSIRLSSASSGVNGINGIIISGGTFGDRINITDNIIEDCNFSIGTTADFNAILSSYSGPGIVEISRNSIRNNNLTTPSFGSFTGINTSGSPQTLNVAANSITGNNLSGFGVFNGINITDSLNPVIVSENIISFNYKTGQAGTLNGISINAANSQTINSNIISENGLPFSSGNNSVFISGITGNFGTGNETINRNRIRKLFILGSNSSQQVINGIRYHDNASSREINNNTIDSLYSLNNSTITGIYSGLALGTANISANKIFDINSGGASASACGILTNYAPQLVTISNNIIGQLYTPTSTNSNAIRGMDISGATSIRIYYNTINLDAVGNNVSFGSSGLFVLSTSLLDLRNNIIINNSLPGGSTGADGVTAAFRRNNSSLTNYSNSSNNNLFFAGIPGQNNVIYCEGFANPVVNVASSILDYKAISTLSPRDSASVSENVSFTSLSGADSLFLHINNNGLTYVEGNAKPINGFTTDYDTELRNVINPDIGADEGGFTGIRPSIAGVIPNPGTGQCTAVAHTINAIVIPGLNPITSVILSYSFGSATPINLSMTHLSGNNWSATIPSASPSNAVVTWTINATDGTYSQVVSGNYQDEIYSQYSLNINASTTPGNVCSSGTTQLIASVIGMATTSNSYCLPAQNNSGNCISNVEFNTLNNSSGSCLSNSYTLFPQSGSTTTTVVSGQSYLLLTTNVTNSMTWVWIDFNGNGIFETTEGKLIYASASSGFTTISIPASAVIGATRMRIRSTLPNGILNSASSCTSITTGETEDYLINIIPPFTHLWSPSNGLSDSSIANPLATVNATSTYFVSAYDKYGCTLPSLTTSINIQAFTPPTPPIANNSIQCGTGIPLCSVTGTGIKRWYLNDSIVSPLSGESGNFLVAYSINTTKHFWVSVFDGSCESGRTEVVAFVNQPDPISANASTVSSCTTNPINLSVVQNGANNQYTYSWTALPITGSGIASQISGQNITVVPTAPGTYVYKVRATDISLNCFTEATITVIVREPRISGLVASATSICPGTNDTLSAFTTLNGQATIGTGNLTNSITNGWPTPYGGYYGGTRSRYMILASELTSAGLLAGAIRSLSFNVVQLGGVATFNGFNIKVGHTNLTSLPTTFQSASLTSVFGPVNYAPVSGINTHNFSVPFLWDGISNLLIEICFNNNANTNATGNMSCKSTATNFTSAIHFGANFNSSVCGNLSTLGQQMQRPNMIISGQVLSPGPGLINWVWNPGGITGNSIVVNPTLSTTYTVIATNTSTTCTSSNSIHINVRSTPPQPTAHDSIHCGTNVPLCFVNGIGNVFRWYNLPVGGNSIPGESGSTLNQYTSGNPTTFYVSEFDGTCESPRIAANEGVIKPDSVFAATSAGPYCVGSTINLFTIQTGNTNTYVYSWNSSPSSGSGLPAPQMGQSIAIVPTHSGTYTYTVTATEGNCATVSSVTLTINENPIITTATANPISLCLGEQITLQAKSFVTTSPAAVIGSDTLTNTAGTYPTPFGHSFGGAKEQYLIPASELFASGLQPGNISSLAIDIVDLPLIGSSVFQNFSISMGRTNLTNLPPSVQTGINGMTQVILIPFDTIHTGINNYTFNNPFNWDGSTNLLIEICFNNNDNGGGQGGNAVVRQSLTSYVSTTGYHISNQQNVCLTNGNASINTFYRRPNFRLGGIVGNDLTSTLSWNWTPGNLSGSLVNIQTTSPGNNTYTVKATNTVGCTSSAGVNVFVYSQSPPPIATNGSHCGNKVPNCSVTGLTGIFKWYLNPTGGTSLAGETNGTLNSYVIGTTTTFYVSEFDGLCESIRVPVIETVIPTDSINIIASSPAVCQGIPITLIANQNGNTSNYSFNWTSSTGGGLLTTSGSQVTATPTIAATITYTVDALDITSGCRWISTINVTSNLSPVVTTTSQADTICLGAVTQLIASANLAGKALQLNGINQYLTIPPSASLNFTTNFTLELWMNPGSLDAGRGLLSKNQSNPNGSYFLRLGNAFPFSGLSTGGQNTINAPLGSLSLNTWYHVAVVYSNLSGTNNNVTIYLNGNVIATGISTVGLNTDSLRIGIDYGNVTFLGLIDEVRIWNSPLNISTIQNWMNKPLDNSHPNNLNLKTYFDFNFPSGLTITDLSGNGNHGFIVNNASILPSNAPINAGITYAWTPTTGLNNPTVYNPIASTTLPGLQTYHVTATAQSGCSSGSTSLFYATQSAQDPIITSALGSIVFCNTGSDLLTLQNARIGNQIKWQISTDNIIWQDIPNANGISYQTSVLTRTTYFRSIVSCTGSDTSNVLQLTIDVPTITSTTGAMRCGSGQVSLQVTGNGNINWFANSTGGNSLFNGNTYQPTVSVSTTFWVESNINGCLFSGSRQPVVASVIPAPLISSSSSANLICSGSFVNLSAISSNDPNYSYVWTPGNLIGASVSVSPNFTTIYTVTATDTTLGTNNGCIATSMNQISVSSTPPVAIISPSSPSICSTGGSVSLSISNIFPSTVYRWNPGNFQGTSYTVSPTTTTTYTVTATKSPGCTSTANVTVNYSPITQPVISTQNTFTVCQGDSITLSTAGSYTTYNWFIGTTNIGSSPSITISPLTNVLCSLIVSNGSCFANTTQAITVKPFIPPTVSSTNNQTVFCEQDSLLLSINPSYQSYLWKKGLVTVSTAQNFYALTSGMYTANVTSANGCTATGSITITTNPSPPVALISTAGPILLCDDGSNSPSILLTDTTGSCPNSTLIWNDLGGSTGNTLSVNYNDLDLLINGNSFNYYFTVTNSFGCSKISNLVTATTLPCSANVSLNVRLFLEGFYTMGGNGLMDNQGSGGCLYLNGISTNPFDVDTVTISLVDASTFALAESSKGILKTNGNVSVSFQSPVVPGLSYYIIVNHRNSIETWSANPVTMNSITNYDFTLSQSQAYGNNMVNTLDGLYWAIYSGDISDAVTGSLGIQDGVIESQDYTDLENAILYVLIGYVVEDITGDGVVESIDYSIMENNIFQSIYTLHP